MILSPGESLARLPRLSGKKAKSSSEVKIVSLNGKLETESTMAQGSKKKYTSKQKRKASKIEKGYKKRGVSGKEAERRAWATVNKSDKGGRKKGGGGRGKSGVSQVPARAGKRAVGSKASYLTNIAIAAPNISAAVSPTIT